MVSKLHQRLSSMTAEQRREWGSSRISMMLRRRFPGEKGL